MMAIRLYVVDTSYLLELFRVDGCSTDSGHRIVKQKFMEAIDRKDSFYVPLPALFELANHIADVKDASRRRALSEKLRETVYSCLEHANPWVLTPSGGPETIRELMEALRESVNRFASEFSQRKLGLTDTVVIREAERLRKVHQPTKLKSYYVHIWTRHREMKSHEPDTESTPFV